MEPRARFDDLRPRTRRSFTLDGFVEALVAEEPGHVRSVLDRAERAVADGRWVAGFVTYEAAVAFDDAFRVHPVADTPFATLPLAWFGVYERRVASPPVPETRISVGQWVPTMSEEEHRQGVEEIRSAILAGDTYQVNHTFRLSAGFEGDPERLYHELIAGQSCGYGAFIHTGEWALASASPELFFEWRHGRLTSRPMKGTAPRGLDLAEDEDIRTQLTHSEKERAENLMIVDMVRNDLGRIARPGSVQVPALFTAEKYDTVWQMTSTVTAEPRAGTELADVFEALFPCASITGAPKVATMDLITRLETMPRGVYCGAIGYGGPRPSGPEWAFNVAIRTVAVDDRTKTAWYGTGGGVTFDSTPGGEYREAILKARVLERRGVGFSLLETMHWSPSHGFRNLTAHLARLTESAWYFDVPLDPAEVRSSLDGAVRFADSPQRVRLLVARDGTITTDAGQAPPAAGTVRVVVDDPLLDPRDPLLRHKTTERTVYVDAAQRHPDADDVILVTVDGLAADTTIATLCVELDGTWCTPPVTDGALPGVARRTLIESGRLKERSIRAEDLFGASRLARVNSLRGWEEITLAEPSTPHPASQVRRLGR
ncbi:MAG: aminodeoxychorismate synthase component I [Acidimicrobiia bacterium]|nr:aminodeoxychorismate synthase component I [Acidimicrobiia bacterium]